MSSNDNERSLCVSLHDVAPATWPACEWLLRWLDRLGAGPVTLLLVPDYHRQGPLAHAADFCKAMDQRLHLGDELALHGFFHLDDGRRPKSPASWLRRRLLTAGEGEFSALSAPLARQRLEEGLSMLHARDWPVHGFVAPAWQLGAQARTVLAEYPFEYTTTRTDIWRLPNWQRFRATSLVYSVRSHLRRRMSWYWNDYQAKRQADAALLRISLHPADASYPEVMTHWQQLITAASRTREALTKHAWVMRQA